ncbi:histidine kinase N-terminal 7TM domain-containing diguanylate cyclase [Clostridium felsineum]|uniref:histidine kinase N-terminal 7TM domain-containing diguanylate cyclase n=1 Tax=Clostridium felsineum TaxID=36839 RepID=UPI00098C4860|nr:diguanylate cyclase [Clostridium felsineum]URZ03069.1 hypothetical protein CLAUR_031150 [Clostridium felsineum]
MNLLSLFSYGNFVLFLLLSIYSIQFSPIRSKLNKYSFWVCLALGEWNLCYVFFYIAPNSSTALIWHKLALIGMYCFPAFTLYFFIVLTKRDTIFKNKYHYFIFYLVPAILILISLFSKNTALVQALVQSSSGLGWTYVNSTNSILYWVTLLYLYCYFYFAFFLLYKWGKNSNYIGEKKQARIFILVDATILMLGSITDFFYPLIDNFLPPMANLFTIVFILFFIYIIRRYNMFDIHHIASPELIINTIMDPVMVLDENFKIIRSNPAAENILGYSSSYLKNKNLVEFLLGNTDINNKILMELLETKEFKNKELNVITSKGEIINSLFSASTAEDRINGFLGIMITFKDITEIKVIEDNLKFVNSKYRKTADKLYKIANFDPLTRIANRRLFFENIKQKIKQYEQTGKDFGVIFMDLNGFKPINDKFGHNIGDKALIESVCRLKLCTYDEDVLARMGGDEFVLIVSDTSSINERIDKIKTLFLSPMHIDGCICNLGIAAGTSIYSQSNRDLDELMRIADILMYEDKKKSKVK